MNNDIIVDSLNYHDKNFEKYFKVINKIKYLKVNIKTNDLEQSEITMFDKHKNVLFTSRYEIAAMYVKEHKLWLWAWAISNLNKNMSYISRKVLYYGLDLDKDIVLKSELITSRFKITDPLQIDIHVAIAQYLTKIPIIYKLAIGITEDIDSQGFVKVLDENTYVDDKNTMLYIYIYIIDYQNIKL